MKSNNFLLLYVFLVFGLSVTLWGLELWQFENIFYGLFIIIFQIVLIDIIFKHRESKDSIANYLFVAPTVLFMILIIENLYTPLTISILISLLMLIPIHFLEKYIKYSFVQS